MADDLYSSLREEIIRIKDHSFQRSGTKIMFTTLLMGLGSIKPQLTSIDNITPGSNVTSSFSFHVEPLLYLAPLVAIFYDALLFGDKISIRRIGSFIQLHYSDTFGKWEKFVGDRRFEWHKDDLGELGFTALTLLYCPIVALHRLNEASGGRNPSLFSDEFVHNFFGAVHGWWFLLLLGIWLRLNYGWSKALKRLC
jgi:hypothetical protein